MKNAIISIIKGYQRYISSLMPGKCRYYPTCSQYMLEAINRYGVLRGLIKGVCRLFRCHPFAEGGYDPIETSCRLQGTSRRLNTLR